MRCGVRGVGLGEPRSRIADGARGATCCLVVSWSESRSGKSALGDCLATIGAGGSSPPKALCNFMYRVAHAYMTG